MTHAYDEMYLSDAMAQMASMLDYGVNRHGFSLREFYDLFLNSSIEKAMSFCNPYYMGGKSGIELCAEILYQNNIVKDFPKQVVSLSRSREYWTGWAIAQYQWHSGISYRMIDKEVPIEDVCDMYDVYHEMDINQFYDGMNDRRQKNRVMTYLKLLRENAGYSQSELAKLSGVPVRTIQQYEQRQKNINHARAEYIINLSYVLGCEPKEILER